MPNSRTSSPHQTSPIRECTCGGCGSVALTTPGTQCGCGGSFRASGGDGMVRKAFGLEDTDLRKGGLR